VLAQAKDNSYGHRYSFHGDLKVTIALVINFLKRKSDMKVSIINRKRIQVGTGE